MATFIWDLGFDFNAAPDVNNPNNSPYLQNGFVVIDDTGNVPTTPVGIQKEDVIRFNVFNTTAGAGATNAYSITGGTIQFQNAEAAQESQPYPFGPSPAPTTNSIPTSSGNVTTATLSIGQLGPASITGPSVIFGPASPDLAQFPIWVDVIPGGLTVTNTGRFLMTVSLTVQGPPGPQGQPTAPQTFVADPEMVIGSIG